MTTYLHTNKMRIIDLRDHIQMRHRWRNSSRSFRGGTITWRDRRWVEEAIWPDLPLNVQSTWLLGNPDYAVWSNDCPILFHCTTVKEENSWIDPLVEEVKNLPALRAHRELVYLLKPMLNNTEASEILEWTD